MTSPSCSTPIWGIWSRALRITSRKPSAKDNNPTDCPFFKEFGGYGIANAAPKNVPHKKCNYNKNGRDGGRNGCARKSGLNTGKAEIVTNDGVGTWTRRDVRRISG